MDDTTTATPPPASTAVAVADSANAAAANSKTATATGGVSSSTLKLLIKASNQQYDDLVLESELCWTVMRLKKQISLVYPSKPPVDEQKLIYSGKLLKDTQVLTEVIRSYKDVYTQNHIFHLVYTSKNAQLPSSAKLAPKSGIVPLNTTTSTAAAAAAALGATSNNMTTNANTTQPDGLRQRNVGNNLQQQYANAYYQYQNTQMIAQPTAQQQQQFQQQQQQRQATGIGSTMPFSLPGQYQMQSLQFMQTQQAAMYTAWMQQVYAQYMEQWMRISDTATTLNNPAANAAERPLTVNPYFQQLPSFAPNLVNGAPYFPPVIPPTMMPSVTQQQQQEPQTNAQAAEAQQQQPQAAAVAADEQAEAQPERRFPNIGQEEEENRDWLDSFFAITRLALFLTIMYYNSSPLRCLVVVIIASGIYLYHNAIRNRNAAVERRRFVQEVEGILNEQRQQQNGQPAPAAAAGVEAAAVVDPPNRNAAVVVDNVNGIAAGAAAATPAPTAADATTTENEPVPQPAATNLSSVISVARTFVVTFFTSLLPEAPAL